jgi:hypothetical protein
VRRQGECRRGRQAQGRAAGLASVGIAMEWAAGRTVRWAVVVGVLDGLESQEQEREGGRESLSGLVPLPRADWTD